MVLPYLCRYLTNCSIPKQMEPAGPEMLRHPISMQAASGLWGHEWPCPARPDCPPWAGEEALQTLPHVTAP